VGTRNDDGGHGLNSSVRVEIETSGDYYVKAQAYSTLTGTYQVKVEEVVSNISSDPITQINTGFVEGDNSWTIMVYIAADNNLEAMGLDDINEMEAIDLPDNINVTFLLDRVDGYTSIEGNETGTYRGVVSNDDDMYAISSNMEDIGEQNTGDGDTLTEFINWSSQAATSDNYALVVWNHGGGISGVAWDETSGHDNLTLTEMTSAITDSNVDNFEVLGFDACLQGVIDQSYAVKNVADVVVASEDLEPGDGWDYEGWFDLIANDSDGVVSTTEMSEYIVESYGDFYSNYSYTTQSAVDTSKLDNLTDAFRDFNDSLILMSTAEASEFKTRVNNDVQTFGSYGEYMDIGDFASIIDSMDINDNQEASTGKTVDDYAQALLTAVNEAVISNRANDDDATGISFYYPGYTDQNYLDNFELAQETNIDKLYDVLV
jgi:hypothetical protein